MNGLEGQRQLQARRVRISSGGVIIEGVLEWPDRPRGIVLFAHGSGASRLSPRNNFMASELRRAGQATLLTDLLTPAEDRNFSRRFDIDRLAERLGDVVAWLAEQREGIVTAELPLGIFGAGTGSAAALRLAAAEPGRVRAIVSRGGRPELAGGAALTHVRAPTLFIVGGLDAQVIMLNRAAAVYLPGVKELEVIPGANHLFEEASSLGEVTRLASAWFGRYLSGCERACGAPG